ncbi:hypothetical protein QTJ16_002509 [Diplocarpon rosae]|uniref:Carboxylic ester hydrolase n=1 Tax=Diplocarpon rosae TaxID=946125 RepID=A0AAD9T0H9_9HELO|nr:hypothetical protein QTJ16_002509 [Diplocarpon rosae]
MTFSTARVLRSAFLVGSVVITTVSADVPLVTVLNGTYAGVHSPSYNQDWFLGMPFAYPPVQGPLRLAPPVSLNTSWEGTRDASKFGNTCWGTGNDAERLIGLGLPVSEDCLNINVVRPSNYTDQLLAVAVYIYGGGYHMGGSADPRLNSSYLIQNSISIDKPIVAVSFNYRVSAFGFLAGSALSEAGALNLGFRDQRLALQWIHENIAAFGGDPAKVTIFGESAGAGSVGAQLLAYNGRDDGLFRGAISQSGSPVGFTPWTEFVSGEVWDEVWANLTTGAGCDSAADPLDCLRNAPFDTLASLINSSATTGAAWGPALDNDFVVDLPIRQLERGDFVKVPFMMGTNTDEGSAFVPGSNFDNATFYPMASSKIDTDAEFLGYLTSLGANWTVAQEVFDLYPQNGTEQVVDTYPNDKGAVLGYQYKRACTFAGDYMMIAPTRYAAQVWAAAGVPAYQYRWNVIVNGVPRYVGATHAKEIVFVFDDLKGWDYDVSPWDHRPASYTDLAYTISTTWAAFVATLDPNVNGTVNGIAAWPVYSIGSPSRFVFDANVTSYVEADTTRKKSIEYLINTFKL